jgi:glycosyltransferase involved in cell wall biosynthesis
MLKKGISVILPVYNGEKYLKSSIDSILYQTFKGFELLIINDGSTDGTGQIVSSFDDDRIKVLKNEKNRGIIYSLNRGFSEATGKYIARMDADDIAEKDRLKIQYEFMETNPEIGICGTWVKRFGSLIRGGLLSVPVDNEEIKANMFFFNPFVHPSVIIRKGIIIKNNLNYSEEFKGTEDYKLWIDMICAKNKAANIPISLLKYRISDWSISGNIFFNREKLVQRFKLISDIQKKVFKNAFPDIEFDPEIHGMIYKMRFHTEFLKIEDIKNIADWLKKLIEYNKMKKYCDEETFNGVVLKIFYQVCSQTTYLGINLYNELKNFGNFSRSGKTRLFFKCVIKFGYFELLLKRHYLKLNKGKI